MLRSNKLKTLNHKKIEVHTPKLKWDEQHQLSKLLLSFQRKFYEKYKEEIHILAH